MLGVGEEGRNLSELWTSISELAAQRASCMGYVRYVSMRQQLHGRLKEQHPAGVQGASVKEAKALVGGMFPLHQS